MWLREFLSGIGFAPPAPTRVFCDNFAARSIANNPVSAKNLKHVARRHFFSQDAVRAKIVTVCPVDGHANIADFLTKIYSDPTSFESMSARFRSWISAL